MSLPFQSYCTLLWSRFCGAPSNKGRPQVILEVAREVEYDETVIMDTAEHKTWISKYVDVIGSVSCIKGQKKKHQNKIIENLFHFQIFLCVFTILGSFHRALKPNTRMWVM